MSMDNRVMSMLEDWFEEYLEEGLDPDEAEQLARERLEKHGFLWYDSESMKG